MKQTSLATELLNDMKKQNKRLFIIWIITFLAFIVMTCYTILITMFGHITCSKYGVIYDSFDPRERPAEFAWIV